MNVFKKCAKGTSVALIPLFVAMAFPMMPHLSAYAQEGSKELSLEARMIAAKNLSPGMHYDSTNLNELVDVEVTYNGEKDVVAGASYYCMPTADFYALEDKSEESVKENSGFTTEEYLESDYSILPVTFITYKTVTVQVLPEDGGEAKNGATVMGAKRDASEEDPVKEAEKENEEDSEQDKATEDKILMATDEITFCVTRSAYDIVDTFKSGKWYESSENGVLWKYTINDGGFIDKLYTESTNISGYIMSDTLMVPDQVNGIPVVGIGSGGDIPFIPSQAGVYSEIDFPPTLLMIGDYAFCKNKAYTDAEFSRTLQSIGTKAFYSSNLKEVTVTGKTDVGELSFANCRFLEKVNILGDVTVERRAFDGGMGGSSLSQIVVSGSPALKDMAFCNNTLLSELTATDKMLIEKDTFKGCDNIENVTVIGDVNIPDGAFANAKINRVKMPN